MPDRGHGPFDTRDQARAVPSYRAAHAEAVTTTRPGVLAGHGHKILCSALSEAGVELGRHDHAIVTWLAGLDLLEAVVVADWIARAAKGDGDV